jgi:oligopeptide transport system substrate-binding protein
MSMNRKGGLILAMLAIVVLLLSACTAPVAGPAAPAAEEGGEAAAVDKVLRVNLGTFPDMLDPQKSSFVNEIANLKMIYEGLTRQDGDLATVPAAAESWAYNEDATQLTFTLRSGCSTATARRSTPNASPTRSAATSTRPPPANMLRSRTRSLGAPEWRACGEDAAACDAAKAQVMESVKASHADGAACTGYDDAECNTLTLTFSRPAPYFHVVSSLWVTFPAKEELITAGGENWWLDAANHIGNGPFAVNILEPFVRASSRRTPTTGVKRRWSSVDLCLHHRQRRLLRGLQEQRVRHHRPGRRGSGSREADPVLSQKPTSTLAPAPSPLCSTSSRNPSPTEGARGLCHAFDREAWVTDVLRGLGSPTLTWIPPGFPGYDGEENRWGFDP